MTDNKRRSGAIRFAYTTVTICVCTMNALADPSREALAKELAEETKPSTLGKRLEQVLSSSNDDDLRWMKECAYSSVSFAAAWEECRRKSLTGADSKAMATQISSARVNYFIGFMEGRLNVSAPEWWKSAILTTNIARSGAFTIKWPNEIVHKKSDDRRFSCPMGIMIVKRGDSYELFAKKNRHSVPIAEYESMTSSIDSRGSFDRMCLTIGKEHLYVAAYASSGFAYTLYCFDRKSSKLVWEQEVWASNLQVASGAWEHIVEVIETDSRVAVFGLDSSSIYVEGFGRKDGKAMGRFSSSKWAH